MPGHLIARRYGYYSIRVNFERHFDLREAARRGRDADKLEPRKASIARRYFALALQHVNFDHLLVIRNGRKDETLFSWNRRVAVKQLGEQSAARLDAETERNHVKKYQVFHIACEHACLYGRADCDDFIRVDFNRRLTLKDFAHAADDDRRARLT